MDMNFLCKCCKSRVTEDKRPEYIESAGIHEKAYHMEWAVFDKEGFERFTAHLSSIVPDHIPKLYRK